MDLKQIEYILKIAEEKNITHAAEKLLSPNPRLTSSFSNWKRNWAVLFFTGHGPTGVRHLPVKSTSMRQDRF